MNIIYMHTHDTGRYIRPYGYDVPTPNLQKLAEEGTLFRHAYCAAPTCSPSRSALLTGMYAHSCGMLGLAHRGFKLNDPHQHLSHYLAGKGMETALCGVQHEAKQKQLLGYRHILDEPSPAAAKGFADKDLSNARLAVQYIRQSRSEPFFLSFGMVNTHRDFPDIAEDINPNYVVPPAPMYDTHRNREDFAAYMTSVRTVDQCVGIVMDALKESGHEDDTLVLFTTDHGIAFPHMKCNLFDTGIGVSLIMKYPNNPSKGKAMDALVSQIDLFPTICDMLGLSHPDWLQGESLLPLLQGKTERVRDEVFAEVSYHAAYEPMRCVRTDRYKLIRFYDDHDEMVPANIDDCASKDFLLESGLLNTRRDSEQLFDLYLDPMERVNLMQAPAYASIREDLSRRLDVWMNETNDPLLSGGSVPKPEGAQVNKRTSISPRTNDFE